MTEPHRPRWGHGGATERWLLPLLLLALAAFFRLWRLDELPPGMFVDIGTNGLDVRDVQSGTLSVFFERNFGREALFIYWQALLVTVAGPSPFVFSFSAVVVGMLAVALTYRLYLDLFGRRVALLASLLLALSFWFVDLNRFGQRSTSLPAFLLLTLLCLWRTLRRGDRRYAVFGGLALGLSLYTYLSARALPILIVLLCLAEWRTARQRWRELALFVLVSMIVFLPEGVYFLQHREDLMKRAAAASVFNPMPDVEGRHNTPLESVLNTAGMFIVRGDENQRHNVPNRPIFADPLTATLFIAGVGLALARGRSDGAYRWPLLWLLVMTLPSALSHESPSMFRVLSAAPAVFVFPAMTLEWIRGRVGRWRRLWAPLVALLIAGWGATTFDFYFRRWGEDPRTYQAFDGSLLKLARYFDARPERTVYFSLDRRPTIEFVAPRSYSARWSREESAAVAVPIRPDGDVLYLAAPRSAMAGAVPAMLPDVERLPVSLAPDGTPDFLAFRWPMEANSRLVRDVRPLAVDMLPDLRLEGYRIASHGGQTTIDLFWRQLLARGPYDLYVHALDSGERQVAQSDRLVWAIDEGPPRDDWLMTRHELTLTPGRYIAEAGAVHRSIADRGQLVGGPIGAVARIPFDAR